MPLNLIDIDVIIHAETKAGISDEGSVLVSTDGNSKNAVWIPKSLIKIEIKKLHATITLPEHLAFEKGLI